MKNELKNNTEPKKIRVKIKPVLCTIFLFAIGITLLFNFIKKPISNIYITGNKYLTDWEIIKLANLDDYPSWISVSNSNIEKELEENILISNAEVDKQNITTVNIKIKENIPLFFDTVRNKTILYNGQEVTEEYDVPIMLSSLTGELYVLFLEGIRNINEDVLNKISEIVYSPDEVDDERILVTMTDGNYVYLTLKKFKAINDYNNIVKEFDNKKGILYLNSGGYFKIMEN